MHWPGIEPGPPAWQARILPLNHQCLVIRVRDFFEIINKFSIILKYFTWFTTGQICTNDDGTCKLKSSKRIRSFLWVVCKEVWKVSRKDSPGFVSFNKITGLCSISFKFPTYINRSQAFLLCFVLFVCFALSSLNYFLSIAPNRELHWWFSGRVLARHAGGPGSIPGQCIFLIACTILNIYKYFFEIGNTSVTMTPKHSLILLQLTNLFWLHHRQERSWNNIQAEVI